MSRVLRNRKSNLKRIRMNWNILLKFLFLILFTSRLSANIHSPNPYNYVHYLDFLIPQHLSQQLTGYIDLPVVSKTDDRPSEQVQLPFSFPFFGVNQNTAFINTNGMIQFDTKYLYPCGAAFCYNHLDNAVVYVGVIGAYLIDLVPSKTPDSKIKKYVETNKVTIAYQNLKLFNQSNHPSNISFSIQLNHDGHIAIDYYKVINPDLLLPSVWSVGLRASPGYYFTQTKKQKENQRLQWHSNVSGVYPLRATITSNKTYHLCPVSDSVCLQPTSILTNTKSSINITFLSLSCQNLLNFVCIFTDSSSSSTSIDSTTAGNTITCPVPKGVTDNAGLVSVTIRGYNSAILYLTYVDILLSPLNLTISSPVNTANCSATWKPGYSPLPANTSGSSEIKQCSVCDSNTPLKTWSTAPCTTIYDVPSCNNTCVTSTPYQKTYTSDYFRTCCHYADIDCEGVCYGYTRPYLDPASGLYKCQACQKCNGKCADTCVMPILKMNISVLQVQVSYPTYSIDNVATYLYGIAVTNPSGYALSLAVNVSGALSVDPIVTIPTNMSLILPPLSTSAFTASISLSRIFTRKSLIWAVKTITVSYSAIPSITLPVNVSLSLQTIVLPVYVQVTGCKSITSASICSASPGCMYCPATDGLRVLRSEDESYTASMETDSLPSSMVKDQGREEDSRWINRTAFGVQFQRLLYNNIVPAAQTTGDLLLDMGSCVDVDQTCPLRFSVATVTEGAAWVTAVILSSIISVALCLYSHAGWRY